MPAVSIIVPVYNVEKYLAECLDSLLAQTMDDFEIICVNDGSSDKSGEILMKYKAKDSRITVITQKNQGVSAARNVAVEKAKGDYLYFMDSDDIIRPDTLEILMDNINKDCADIVVFGLYDLIEGPSDPWFDTVSSPNDAWFTPFDPWALFYEPGATPYAARDIFRRELVIKNNITFNTHLKVGEDLLYQFLTFPAAQRIRFIPDKLYGYRRLREASATRQHVDPIKLVLQHIEVSRYAHEEWEKRGYLKLYGLHLYCWMLNFNFARIANLPQKDKAAAAKELLKIMTYIDEYLPEMPPADQDIYNQLREFVPKATNNAEKQLEKPNAVQNKNSKQMKTANEGKKAKKTK